MAQERGLPEEFIAGMNYFNEQLVNNNVWFRTFEGQHVAILNRTVVDMDNDHARLATTIRAQFPDHVLYQPHVVRLSPDQPKSDDPEIPDYWIEAEAYYLQVLRENPRWLRTHLGQHVAIIGRQVVGQDYSFHQLSTAVHSAYGDGAMFIPRVTSEYPEVVHFRSPGR